MTILQALCATLAGAALLALFACQAPSGQEKSSSDDSVKSKGWEVNGRGRWIHLPEVRDEDGTLYLSSHFGLQAVNERGGNVKWVSAAPGNEWERVLRADGNVLAYSNGYLRSVDAKSGSQRWIANGVGAASRPVIAAGGKRIWVLTQAGELATVDSASGVLTKFADRPASGSVMTECEGILLLATQTAHTVEARDFSDGHLLWTRTIDDDFLGNPSPWIAATAQITTVSTPKGIAAFHTRTGEPAWNYATKLKNPYVSHYQLLGDKLFWVDGESSKQTIHAMDAGSGKELWTAGGFQFLLQDLPFVRAVDDLWAIPTAASVTILNGKGEKIATVEAYSAQTAGEPAFARDGEYGYAIASTPPAKKAWEPVQSSKREKSTLIVFKLRTGDVVRRVEREGFYDLLVVNGRLLIITEEGLLAVQPLGPA